MEQKAIEKMDINKKVANGVAEGGEQKRLSNFFKEVKGELKKVEWTSQDELRSYVKIVLISTFCFGMGVYLVDLVIRGFIGGINLLFG